MQTGDGRSADYGPQEEGFVLAQFALLDVEENGCAHLAYYELPESPRSSTGIIYSAHEPIRPNAVLAEEEMIPDSFELGYGFPNLFYADMLIPFALARLSPCVERNKHAETEDHERRTLLFDHAKSALYYDPPWAD